MKSAVLVSSMAILASAGTAFPKTKDMSEIRKSLKTERAKFKVAAKVNGAKAGAMAAESLLKEEGISVLDVKSMDHDEIFFEMRKGLSDCDSTVKMVEGFEVNRCINGIWDDAGFGRPESEVFIKPKNGGFPIALWFDGHGCNEDRLYGWQRVPKTWLGYAPDYETGDCDPMMAGDGTTVLFHQGAGWKSERYEPMDDAIMTGFDGSERGCQRNKYQGYSIQSADFCGVAEEDDMTGMPYSWSKFDVSNCDSGSVDEVFYSDPDCSSMMYSETRYRDTCVFDNMQFQDQIMYDSWGYLEFTSHACHKMTSTGPI